MTQSPSKRLVTEAALALKITGISVKEYGAVGDGVTDDTAEIQAAINAVRDSVRLNSMAANNMVTIPSGRYVITNTITLPPYVKLNLSGTVVFEYTGVGTCLHITPLADDPVPLYAGLTKQQWNNSPMIMGGYLVIKNTADHVGTGLEVGSRTDLGVNLNFSKYHIPNVAVTNCSVGLLLNAYNHYIGMFSNLHLEINTTNIKVGSTAYANVNSGENFEFNHCTFAGAHSIIDVQASGWDLHFVNCSFDYSDRVATIQRGYGLLHFQGGHIEAINYIVPNAADAVIVGEPTDGVAQVQFDGTTMLVNNRPQFIGSGVGTIVAGTIYFRHVADYVKKFSEGLYLAPSVEARNLHNLNQVGGSSGPLHSKHNLILHPAFENEVIGGVAGSPTADWAFDASGVGVEFVNDPAVAGGKALKLTLNPSSYITLTAKNSVPLKSLDDFRSTFVFKTDDNGFNCAVGAVYTNPDGTDQAAEPLVNPYRPLNFALNTWETFQFLTQMSADRNIASTRGVKPQYLISNGTASVITVTIGYLYFGE